MQLCYRSHVKFLCGEHTMVEVGLKKHLITGKQHALSSNLKQARLFYFLQFERANVLNKYKLRYVLLPVTSLNT